MTSANAHIHTDEGGAPERVTGLKLLPVQTPDGKLTPSSSTARPGAGATSTVPSRSP